MKNKLSDLKNHLFAALERLGDEDIEKIDVAREQTIANIGSAIINSAKLELQYLKMVGAEGIETTFFDTKKTIEISEAKNQPLLDWNKV